MTKWNVVPPAVSGYAAAMRLGEALTRRGDLRKRVAQLTGRLQTSAVVQEGDVPPEDPTALLRDLKEMER